MDISGERQGDTVTLTIKHKKSDAVHFIQLGHWLNQGALTVREMKAKNRSTLEVTVVTTLSADELVKQAKAQLLKSKL